MENNTSFDLNLEIRRWKEKLAQNPGFRGDDLDELECHLQDSVRELQARGLSAGEAFTIATLRVGSGPMLASEYGRINGSTVWIDRMLWMLIGWVCVSVIQSLVVSVGVALTFPRELPSLIPSILWVSPLILAALGLRSLVSADGRISRLMTQLLCQPFKLSIVFFAIGLIPTLMRAVTISYITGLPMQEPIVEAALLSMIPWFIVALLILLLARMRLRPARLGT